MRQLLGQIVAASPNVVAGGTTEQEAVLQRTQQANPAVATFLDKAMVVAGILKRRDADTPLETWLSTTSAPLHVNRKPLPRRTPMYTAIPTVDTKHENDADGSEDDSDSSSDSTGSSSQDSDSSEEE